MKITLFTCNKTRHNYFINLLSTICDQIYVVQESKTVFPNSISEQKNSKVISEYFKKVDKAQQKFFGNSYINNLNKNIKILPLLFGDLNNCPIKLLNDFLKSDLYIVFGSSFIKGDLADFLIKKRAINIHMGISPYYRGTDCNFWALYDNNPHLVGATIHYLSKGLDNGPILYHAMSKINNNSFEYTMSTVKSAFHSLLYKIERKTLFKLKPINQNKKNEIRYSKKKEFNELAVKNFLKKKIDLRNIEFDEILLKNPYFLN
jgi:methionyl-tRNA formyltransferase